MTKTRDAGVPAGYDPSQFPPSRSPWTWSILTMSEGMLHVLLVCRGEAPFEGMWAIPGGFKRPGRDARRGREAGAGEETGVDAASLLTQFGAYGDPGRDPRMNVVTVGVPRGDARRRRDRRRLGRRRGCARPGHGRPQREDRAGLRPPTDRARCDRARARRARGHGRRDRVRGADVHAGRAAGGLRGGLGRAARRSELPAEHRRRGRLGDPDRAPRAARAGRRQARGALPRRPRVEAAAGRSTGANEREDDA